MRFYKLVNPVLQLTAEYATGYTSSDLLSLFYYTGPGDVKGILTGEISGKAIYTALLGWSLTYFDRDRFTLEQLSLPVFDFFIELHGIFQPFDLGNHFIVIDSKHHIAALHTLTFLEINFFNFA